MPYERLGVSTPQPHFGSTLTARVDLAMRQVPRGAFLPTGTKTVRRDGEIPIGGGEVQLRPSLVALLTELALIAPTDRVLEVGTGSGYHTAVLAELAEHVYSVELKQPLAEAARERLSALGYDNVDVRCGDGYRGWVERAPFDAIVVTGSMWMVPPSLIDQLAEEGRMVVPIRDRWTGPLKAIRKLPGGRVHCRELGQISLPSLHSP